MRTGVKWLIVASVVAVPVVVVATRSCACSDTRYKAWVAGAKQDLRHLVVEQESARAHGSDYRVSFDTAFMDISQGVTLEILEATDSGWQAAARHDEMEGRCVVWAGRVAAHPSVNGAVPPEREPACDMRKRS